MEPKSPALPAGYRLVPKGEMRRVGDLAWTWANPECTRQGWVPIETEEIIDEGHVPVIRAT